MLCMHPDPVVDGHMVHVEHTGAHSCSTLRPSQWSHGTCRTFLCVLMSGQMPLRVHWPMIWADVAPGFYPSHQVYYFQILFWLIHMKHELIGSPCLVRLSSSSMKSFHWTLHFIYVYVSRGQAVEKLWSSLTALAIAVGTPFWFLDIFSSLLMIAQFPA